MTVIEEAKREHHCPICGTPLAVMVRYPDYICRDCALRATSEDGRALRFTNESISGGVLASYADNGETYSSARCWIDGVECEAREAKFGGIVFQPTVQRETGRWEINSAKFASRTAPHGLDRHNSLLAQ